MTTTSYLLLDPRSNASAEFTVLSASEVQLILTGADAPGQAGAPVAIAAARNLYRRLRADGWLTEQESEDAAYDEYLAECEAKAEFAYEVGSTPESEFECRQYDAYMGQLEAEWAAKAGC
jgi:hypothetical protein